MARVLLVALMVAVFACAPLALAQNTPQAAPAQPDFSKVTIKADLQNYRTPLVEARDRIAKLIKQGKTIDAAVGGQAAGRP